MDGILFIAGTVFFHNSTGILSCSFKVEAYQSIRMAVKGLSYFQQFSDDGEKGDHPIR